MRTRHATLIWFSPPSRARLKIESRDGDTIGSVHAFMVHKRSGRATHAVLALGGFLGMGKSFYPVPFSLLQFDPWATNMSSRGSPFA